MIRAVRSAVSTGVFMISISASGLTIIYPQPYTLFQRNNATEGVIRIRGTFPAGKHSAKLEARLAGGPWRGLD